MHIDGNGEQINLELEGDESNELRKIAMYILPEWLAVFQNKNRDYGSGSMYELGVRGQYSDIHRKMIKLKRAMWEGESLKFEGLEEIIGDLIGHLFLTLHMLELQKSGHDEYIYGDDTKAADTFIRMVGDGAKAFNLAAELPDEFRRLVQEKVVEDAKVKGREEKKASLRSHLEKTYGDGLSQDPSLFAEWRNLDAAEGTPDTFPQWLHNRFGKGIIEGAEGQWEALSEDDQSYWEHQAEAVVRAYKRGGFKNTDKRIQDSFDEVQQKMMAERLEKNEEARIQAMAMEAEGSTFSDAGFMESDQEQALGSIQDANDGVYKYAAVPGFDIILTGKMSPETADAIMGPPRLGEVHKRHLESLIRQSEDTTRSLRELYQNGSGL